MREQREREREKEQGQMPQHRPYLLTRFRPRVDVEGRSFRGSCAGIGATLLFVCDCVSLHKLRQVLERSLLDSVTAKSCGVGI